MSDANFQIPVHQIDATKKRVHPRFVTGFYQNIRVFVMYFSILLFVALPWLRWDGHQAIQFNFSGGQIVLFGATFLPQDVYFFAFSLRRNQRRNQQNIRSIHQNYRVSGF